MSGEKWVERRCANRDEFWVLDGDVGHDGF
jgi:hypothetical protein